MSETSEWAWTLTIKVDGQRHVLSGGTIAPAGATKDTILPGILKDLRSKLRKSFSVEDFSATRTR